MIKTLRIYITVFILIFGSLQLKGQTYQVSNDQSEMKISGTSTLHDWHAEVNNIQGAADFEIVDLKLVSIETLNIQVVVSSIESGKNGMDKNAHEALKKSEHPEIEFTLTRIESITSQEVTGAGLLTIAGTAREVSMNVAYSIDEKQAVQFDGNLDLNMTDYEVDPPTAMLGTVKTGDAINIEFMVRFVKK